MRRHALFPLCLLAIFLFPASAIAGINIITDGPSLLTSCHYALKGLDNDFDELSPEQQNDSFVCMAYLGGIMGATHHAARLAKLRYAQTSAGKGDQRDFNLYCINWELKHHELARLLLRYARRNPDNVYGPAYKLVFRALEDAYPCR
ncbi:MAG: hypothetical protein GXP17_03960 [Gammaproteobacteria bacterium]|nr:hypothetical protein [Gammaproteobacteria bacterium]